MYDQYQWTANASSFILDPEDPCVLALIADPCLNNGAEDELLSGF